MPFPSEVHDEGPRHLSWLEANGHDTAPLTGTDAKALHAIDRAWELYAYTRSERVLRAIALLALEMQERTRPLARYLIPRAMDWNDEERLWARVEQCMNEIGPPPACGLPASISQALNSGDGAYRP